MENKVVEESIKRSIRKNGFPDKTVRLSFQQVFISCKKHGTSLKQVLHNLEIEKIQGTINGDYIVFREAGRISAEPQVTQPETPFDFSNLNSGDLIKMQAAAQEHLKNLTPEQKEHFREMAGNLSEEDKAKIMKLFSKMRPPGDNRG